jgi:hypothetical protein
VVGDEKPTSFWQDASGCLDRAVGRHLPDRELAGVGADDRVICYIPETLRHGTRLGVAADRIVLARPWTLAGVPM